MRKRELKVGFWHLPVFCCLDIRFFIPDPLKKYKLKNLQSLVCSCRDMLPLCYPYRSTGPYGRWLSQPQFVDENTVYIGAVPLYHPIFCSIYLYMYLDHYHTEWTPNGLIADDRFDPRHHSLRTQCHGSAHVWRSDEVPMRPPNFLILGIILAYLTIYIILNSSNLRAA